MEVTISSWSALSSPLMQTNSSISQSQSPPLSESVIKRQKDKEISTDAYLPEFFVAKDLTPRTSELLVLGLKHREKLSAVENISDCQGGVVVSDAQVELIEQLRKQRRLEATLPPVTDAFSLKLRTKQMETAEFESWKRREREMKEINEKRLVLIRGVLKKYLDEHVYERIKKKLAMVKNYKESEVARYLVACERTRNKILRKLRAGQLRTLHTVNNLGTVGREKQLNSLRILDKLDCFKTVDIAEQPVKFRAQFEVEVQELNTIDGLNSVQLPKRKSLPAKPAEPVSNSLRPSDKEMLGSALRLIKTQINWRARAKAEAVMQGAENSIKAVVGLTVDNMNTVLSTEGKEETPRIDRPASAEDKAEVAEVQRIVRGLLRRAEMEKSLETRKLLIQELRAVEKETDFVYSDDLLQEVEASIGGIVSQALDDLSKELIRLEEEQRLSVAVFAIARERRMKEAEEAGRRQHEELRRDREDEIFRQIMQVNRGTVASYIDDIIGNTIASMVANVPDEAVDVQVAQTDEEELDEAGIAAVVVDVVKTFLFPHIDREDVHRKLLEKRSAVNRATVASLNVLVDSVISAKSPLDHAAK